MKKIYFLFLFLLPGWINVFGGLQSPLEEKLDSLASFNTTNYQEQVYIHSDKQHYLTGETMKFKVYCIEKNTSRTSELSRIAYVEIIDEEKTSHLRAKIQLKDGVGFGELYIPTNLLSGNYILRGYTRWMRNFGPEVFYHSMITLINPFKKLGLPSEANIENTSVRFFSEGGPVIHGQETNIVCELKNENGLPLNKTIRIIANDSLIVNEVNVSKNGIGGFTFSPDIFNKYHVEVLHEDSLISKHPFVALTGKDLSMKVFEQADKYAINIFCNDPSIIDQADDIFIIAQQKEEVFASKQFSLNKGRYNLELSKELIHDGIFTVWLFGKNGDLLRQRSVLKYSDEHKIYSVDTDKNSYATRERIGLDFTTIPGIKSQNSYNFSVSIGSVNDQISNNLLNMKEYLLLENSLIRKPYNLKICFEGSNQEISRSINQLLIAYGEMHADQWEGHNPKKYVPELRSHIITGKVMNKLTGEPQAGVMSYLSVPGKRLQFYANRSKSNGELIFELKEFYGSNEIVVQNDYTKDSVYTIELDNPFSNDYLDIELPPLDISEDVEDWIITQSQNMQVNNAYKKFAPKPPVLTEIDSSSFYHDPDMRYYLDDYTRFIVMEEVMREYIAGVNVRKNRDGFHFMVVDIDRNIIYDDNPLILLDAVPVFDADDIIALDPLKIEKIETIKGRFHYGYLDCQGIVNYSSYNGDLAGYELPEGALVFAYDGIQWERKYEFPTYSDNQKLRSKIPDYRNSLYWAPNISLTAEHPELEIFSSDHASKYEIRIEGIDEAGNVISAKKIIDIVASPNN